MSHWNYRLVQYKDDQGFGLHEVYYDDADQPWGRTDGPATFGCDSEEGPEGIIKSLEMALNDAKTRSILVDPIEWPGKAP